MSIYTSGVGCNYLCAALYLHEALRNNIKTNWTLKRHSSRARTHSACSSGSTPGRPIYCSSSTKKASCLLSKHCHMSMSENRQRSLRGELYHAFTPELVAARRKCAEACGRYNNAGFVTRRRQLELWRE